MDNTASKLTPQERYLHKPFLGSSHNWAFEQLKGTARDAKVLDFGSGSGCIGRYLKDIGLRQIYAVDIDPAARDHVREVYHEVTCDISSLSCNEFDIILALDVLEHTSNPEGLLKIFLSRLKPGGTLLISVPNIAHWSIRFSLLFGFFNYTERGILDKTHLHFFTKRSLSALLLSQPGTRLVSSAASIPPAEFVLPSWVSESAAFQALNKAHLEIAQVLPGFFGYQLLARIEKFR